jgi:glycosyltransferase involved in cell wall biosynthesis
VKVSIITRAFNRLEYTIACVNGVRDNAGYEDYEHIVVDQGSTDGTGEWLKWACRMPNAWYGRLRTVHLKRNRGDFGGMKAGLAHARGDLVMQLDNDVLMETPGWLDSMVRALFALEAEAVMPDRRGCKEVIPRVPGTESSVVHEGKTTTCVKVPFAVMCYLMKRDLFERRSLTARRCRDVTRGGNTWMVLGVTAVHLDGYDTQNGSYVQHAKYDFMARDLFLSGTFLFRHGRRKRL